MKGYLDPARARPRASRLDRDLDRGIRRRLDDPLDAAPGLIHHIAADGEETLRRYVEARANGRPFDVLILDLTVPGGMGGEKTLQCLLQIDPVGRQVTSKPLEGVRPLRVAPGRLADDLGGRAFAQPMGDVGHVAEGGGVVPVEDLGVQIVDLTAPHGIEEVCLVCVFLLVARAAVLEGFHLLSVAVIDGA